MLRFFAICGWEFTRHLRSRAYLMWTLVAPLLLTALFLIPSLYYQNNKHNTAREIGYVVFDSTAHFRLLSERMALQVEEQQQRVNRRTQLVKIEADTTTRMLQDFKTIEAIKTELDSLEESYIKVRERRRFIFQRPESRTREKMLNESYNVLITTREQKDLASIEYTRMKVKLDSLVQRTVLQQADSLLESRAIDGYLVLDSENFREGRVSFYSLIPMDYLNVNDLKQSLQGLLVEERMRKDGLTLTKTQELLSPIIVDQHRLVGSEKYEYHFLLTYVVPGLVILLLMVSIYSTCSFLYSSLVAEKASRVLEMLLGSSRGMPLILAKVLGCGLLGLLQLALWFAMILFLIALGFIPLEHIEYFTLTNAAWLLLFYVLGYLLYAAIYTGAASISSSRHDADKQAQSLRTVLFLPVLLTVIAAQAPDAILVRFLSFFPLFTPIFMPLRLLLTPLPIVDIYISIGLMAVAILLCYLFAGNIFRATALLYDKKAAWRSILRMLQVR